ncbi:MAG: ankyrin repeat domain-containing protein [Elusimicrobia bacterium]|nr:ankyrin repeat domain-containing protein [Elusimicrobiota bacterium]
MDARSSMALTAVMRLIDAKDAEGVRQAIAKGTLDAEARAAAFVYSARKPCLEIITMFLAAGADINSKNRDGITALMSASANGYMETVKFLTEKGIDINARDNSGMTALRYANANENDDVARLLKTLGAK